MFTFAPKSNYFFRLGFGFTPVEIRIVLRGLYHNNLTDGTSKILITPNPVQAHVQYKLSTPGQAPDSTNPRILC